METFRSNPEFVRGEMIPELGFTQEDALLLFADRQKRYQDLERAVLLAREHQGKVKIIFRTGTRELKRVYSTVVAFDSEKAILMGGASLPIRSILAVEFF
jgi:hypothetical protein